RGMTLRRYVVGALVGLSVGASYDIAGAQVGHDPGSSPYRDIPWHKGPVFFAGYLSGDRGEADAGMTNAQTEGGRWEMNAGKTMLFVFSGAYLMGDRYIIDPRLNRLDPNKKTGPYPSNIGTAEIALQLKLTGNKSWHRLAPYIGTGLGLAFDIDSPGHTTRSGYALATRRFWGRRAALTVVNTALAFPTVVVGLLLYALLSRRGPLGAMGWLYTWQAIVLGDVCLALPIAAALSAAAVQGVDPRIRRTAETLGAGPWRTAWTV